MSYHTTLGAGFSISVSGRGGSQSSQPAQPPQCPAGQEARWSRSGYACVKSSTSTITPAPTVAAPAPAPTTPPKSTLSFEEAYSAGIYRPISTSKTYTVKPTTQPSMPAPAKSADPSYAPSESVMAEQPKLGFNWVPWAVGAAGLALVVFVVRRS